MSFTKETGDLFAHPSQALAHGVNCVGVAGAGVAAVMKAQYPRAVQQYVGACFTGELKLGGALLCPHPDGGKTVIHCASQYRPGSDARADSLRSSLQAGLGLAETNGIASVALPLIGGGIGGLDPRLCEQIIREVAEASPIAVTLVTLA